MSLSGESEPAAGSVVAASVLNEGDPREASSSEGETNEPTANTIEPTADKTVVVEPERPKLWSEFSDDEDPIDTTLAREQLRKVCLASVGVRPCDLPTPTSQSLQRTKTTRYSNNQSAYGLPSSSYQSSSGRKSPTHRRVYNSYGSGSPCHSQRGRRQDSLNVWQEAASKSRTSAPPVKAPTSSSAAGTKRRFGGLSFDVLVSYKSESKSDSTGSGAAEAATEQDAADKQSQKSTSVGAESTTQSEDLEQATSNVKQTLITDDEVSDATKMTTDVIKQQNNESATLSGSNDDLKTSSTSSEGMRTTSERACDSEVSPTLSTSDPTLAKKDSLPSTASLLESTALTMESSISTCSSSGVYIPRVSRSAAIDIWSDEETNPDGLIEPRLREVDGDVIFDEKFDIWFTQPLSGARRGLAKEVYENGMHLIGTFNTLSQFFEFHGILEWDDLPPSSVIAFCRHGIKPIWEDPANEKGGRYLVKNFKREDTEAVFTKMALGFLSGMLHDWKHYNLISLHVRETRRGNDIQLWRSKIYSSKLTTQTVKADLQDFVENSQPNMTISFVPNKESLSRNDSRLQQQSGHRRSKGGKHKNGNRRSTSVVTAAYTGGSSHPVFQLYAQKGMSRTFLADEQKAAYARESEACLLTAAPAKTHVTGSLTSDDRLTSCGEDGGLSPVSSEDSGTTISFKRSDIDSPKSDNSLTSPRESNGDIMMDSQDWRKSAADEKAATSETVHGGEATDLSRRGENQGAAAAPTYPPSLSEYTAYVPPDVAMYYPPTTLTPASPDPYAAMYGYGYYTPQDQMLSASNLGTPYSTMIGPWYDSSPAQTYWAPNSAPPDTFCLTPYAYPYAYSAEMGTAYYNMPPMQGAETSHYRTTEAPIKGDNTPQASNRTTASDITEVPC